MCVCVCLCVFKTEKIKEKQHAGFKNPKFSAQLPYSGCYFLQQKKGDKTWWIKNVNCRAEQTVHREFISASELSFQSPNYPDTGRGW